MVSFHYFPSLVFSCQDSTPPLPKRDAFAQPSKHVLFLSYVYLYYIFAFHSPSPISSLPPNTKHLQCVIKKCPK